MVEKPGMEARSNMGNGFGLDGLAVLPWIFMGVCALAVFIPLVIWVIRLLNQTWLDPNWGRREREAPEQVHDSDECPSENTEAIQADSNQGITASPPAWNTRPADGHPGRSAGR
jgi:hypothetical protein